MECIERTFFWGIRNFELGFSEIVYSAHGGEGKGGRE